MTRMRYVIGADGGGTKTDMVLASHGGEVVARETGGCSNLQAIGGENLKKEILATIRRLMGKAGVSSPDVSMVALGLAGAGRRVDQETILGVFGDTPFAGRLFVESDAVSALAGAFANRPGVILIAGTGAICFGKDAGGRVVRAGGWGYLLGDEGGGYFLGREALTAALEDLDGRGGSTSLRGRLEKRFRVSSIDLVIPRVYGGEIDRVAVADLAPLVFEEARKGDGVAGGILARAGSELGRLVKAVLERMQPGEASLPVALIGSVFKQREMLLPAMREEMGDTGEDAAFVDPMFPPSVGAALMALEKSGVGIDADVLRTLRRCCAGPDAPSD